MKANEENEAMRARVLGVVDSNGGLDVGYSFAQIMGALNVDPQDFRDVDRALQSLRRQGVVEYSRKTGWVVAKTKEKSK